MKKIAIVTIIFTLPIFIFSTLVSAEGNRFRNFQGTFEMSLKGNGLNSTLGFEQLEGSGFFVPVAGSTVWASTDTAYGTFVFKRDGTGCASGMNYSFDLPPDGNPFFGGPLARNNPFQITFDYEISPEGLINLYITYPPILTTVQMIGKVSKDRDTMTLTNSDSLLQFLTHDSLFTATRVLIRIAKNLQCE